jgi:HEAT repeat protein
VSDRQKHLDFSAVAGRLRWVADHGPTAKDRQEVEHWLRCPYEGLRSLAVQALGAWGDEESKRQLIELIADSSAAANSGGFRGVVLRSLARCITADDGDWVWEIYRSRLGQRSSYEFDTLLRGLPQASLAALGAKHIRTHDPDSRRLAARALSMSDTPESKAILVGLVDDDDDGVRNLARWHLDYQDHRIKFLEQFHVSATARKRRKPR